MEKKGKCMADEIDAIDQLSSEIKALVTNYTADGSNDLGAFLVSVQNTVNEYSTLISDATTFASKISSILSGSGLSPQEISAVSSIALNTIAKAGSAVITVFTDVPLLITKLKSGTLWVFRSLWKVMKWIVREVYLVTKWIIKKIVNFLTLVVKKLFTAIFWVFKKILIALERILVGSYKGIKWIVLKITSLISSFFSEDTMDTQVVVSAFDKISTSLTNLFGSAESTEEIVEILPISDTASAEASSSSNTTSSQAQTPSTSSTPSVTDLITTIAPSVLGGVASTIIPGVSTISEIATITGIPTIPGISTITDLLSGTGSSETTETTESTETTDTSKSVEENDETKESE